MLRYGWKLPAANGGAKAFIREHALAGALLEPGKRAVQGCWYSREPTVTASGQACAVEV